MSLSLRADHRCNLYDTPLLRRCAEFKAVTDESVDLKEVCATNRIARTSLNLVRARGL